MSNKEPLTEEQRELAAKNHNLIYTYAYKKNISLEDYYGTLAIGLCKAAKVFDKDKGNFSNIAFSCMENELYDYWKSTRKKSSIPENLMLSYDAPKEWEDSDGKNGLLESIPDYRTNDSMMYAVISYEFIEKLTEKEKIIVRLLMDGLTHVEIANELGCKRQNVDYRVKRIREKANDCLNYK